MPFKILSGVALLAWVFYLVPEVGQFIKACLFYIAVLLGPDDFKIGPTG